MTAAAVQLVVQQQQQRSLGLGSDACRHSGGTRKAQSSAMQEQCSYCSSSRDGIQRYGLTLAGTAAACVQAPQGSSSAAVGVAAAAGPRARVGHFEVERWCAQGCAGQQQWCGWDSRAMV
jgi:hypothetical protein